MKGNRMLINKTVGVLCMVMPIVAFASENYSKANTFLILAIWNIKK